MPGVKPFLCRQRLPRRVLALLLPPVALLAACDDECCLSPSQNENPVVVTVEVIPASDSVRAGETIQMQAIPRDEEGNALEGRTIYWSYYTRYSTELFPDWWTLGPADGVISNGPFLSLDTLGLATGWAVGRDTVVARCEGIEGRAALTVTPLPLSLSSISSGRRHSCGLTAEGDAFCWGWGQQGQIGRGFGPRIPFPTLVTKGLSFLQIDARENHTCALTTEGTAYCWGTDNPGSFWGSDDESVFTPTPVSGGMAFRSLSAGGAHTCGVTADGKAYCWGRGGSGQLGNGRLSDATTPVEVRADGVSFASVSAGGNHTCGLAPSGEAYCWGKGTAGALGIGVLESRPTPTPVSTELRFRSIHLGSDHTCALTLAGRAFCWGYGAEGQLGNGDGVDRLVPSPVAGDLTFSSLSAGSAHTCGLNTEGHAYCWGQGFDGQLGNGSSSSTRTPVPVAGGLTFATVEAGGSHTCGITPTNEAYCWGAADDGQLGDGNMAPPDTYGTSWRVFVPARVAGG